MGKRKMQERKDPNKFYLRIEIDADYNAKLVEIGKLMDIPSKVTVSKLLMKKVINSELRRLRRKEE